VTSKLVREERFTSGLRYEELHKDGRTCEDNIPFDITTALTKLGFVKTAHKLGNM
jgi:hypothetical protein